MIVGVLLLGCLFGSLELNKAAKIEVAMRATRLTDIREIDDPAFLASIIGPLQATLPNRWDDALAHRRLAELRMQLYRAVTYQRLWADRKSQAGRTQDQNVALEDRTGDDTPRDTPRGNEEQRDGDLWRRSSVWHLNGTLRQLDRQGDVASIEALQNQNAVQDQLIPALRHVLLARDSAPTIAQLHYMLAELLAVQDVKADDQVHLRRARTLAPGDATMWYWTGLLDLNAGRDQQACQSWRQSLLLSPRHLRDILDSSRRQLTIRQIRDDVLPMHAEMLLNTATEYFAGDEKAAIREQFLKRAEESLSQTVLPPDRLAYVTAKIYRLQGRDEEAVPFYDTAVTLNNSTASWRYEYACLLRDLKRYDEALQQAIYMTSEWPKTRRYRRLYEEISGLRHRSGSST
jgi:tetratricopeptide (TPR) repeat protein